MGADADRRPSQDQRRTVRRQQPAALFHVQVKSAGGGIQQIGLSKDALTGIKGLIEPLVLSLHFANDPHSVTPRSLTKLTRVFSAKLCSTLVADLVGGGGHTIAGGY